MKRDEDGFPWLTKIMLSSWLLPQWSRPWLVSAFDSICSFLPRMPARPQSPSDESQTCCASACACGAFACHGQEPLPLPCLMRSTIHVWFELSSMLRLPFAFWSRWPVIILILCCVASLRVSDLIKRGSPRSWTARCCGTYTWAPKWPQMPRRDAVQCTLLRPPRPPSDILNSAQFMNSSCGIPAWEHVRVAIWSQGP